MGEALKPQWNREDDVVDAEEEEEEEEADELEESEIRTSSTFAKADEALVPEESEERRVQQQPDNILHAWKKLVSTSALSLGRSPANVKRYLTEAEFQVEVLTPAAV